MILTTHILSGAVLGANVQNPYAVAGLAVALHFALDLLPHGDYLDKKSNWHEFWKVAIDIFIGLSAVIAVMFFRDYASHNGLNIENIAIGVFFSLLPDGITLLYWRMGMKFLKPIYIFHQRLHRAPDFSPKREFCLKNNPWDIVISLIAVITLILF